MIPYFKSIKIRDYRDELENISTLNFEEVTESKAHKIILLFSLLGTFLEEDNSSIYKDKNRNELILSLLFGNSFLMQNDNNFFEINKIKIVEFEEEAKSKRIFEIKNLLNDTSFMIEFELHFNSELFKYESTIAIDSYNLRLIFIDK